MPPRTRTSTGSAKLALIGSVFITCLGSSFLIGYNLGIVNLPANEIKDFLEREIILKHQTGAWLTKDFLYAQVSSVFVLAAAMGAFSCGWVADFLGRRNSLLVNNLIGIVGSVLSGLCVVVGHPALLYVGRFFSGINSGITIGVASIYLTEIAPRNLRGMIGACHQLAVTMGIFVAYLATLTQALNDAQKWPLAIGIGAIPPVISCIFFPFCPESARYIYLLKNREEEARVAFQRVNASENVDMFIAEMREEADVARNQPKFKFVQLFKQRDLRMPVLIAVLIQVLQQLSGINAVVANSSLMLQTASVPESQLQYYVLGTGFLNVICTIVALPLLERAGRRTLLLWPTLILGLTLLLQTIMVSVINSKPSDEQGPFAIVSAVLVFVYIGSFAVGLGPIPALIVAEIFRQGPRGAAYSLSQSIQWLCNLIVLFSFPSLNESMKGYVYLPFLVVVVVCWVFFFLFMPETKNRTFDEVARDLAFGTIVVGRRTAALQTTVFTKESNEEPTPANPLLEGVGSQKVA
ncbi:hypothetical protein AAHC03_0270 [Spirometra sp. Aus1]|nr:unnamed protein product [Spirometra erinaceieuropaei]